MDCCVGNKTVGRPSKMSTQLGQVPVNWKAQVFALALGQHWMPQKHISVDGSMMECEKIIQTHFKLIKASQNHWFQFLTHIQISWCDQGTSLGPHTARTLCHTGASSISSRDGLGSRSAWRLQVGEATDSTNSSNQIPSGKQTKKLLKITIS